MNCYDEILSMIDGLERATSVCTKTEILSLYEAVAERFYMTTHKFNEDEFSNIERRLDDARTLIDVRNPEVKDESE